MSGVTGQTGAPFTFLPVKMWLWWRGRARKFLDVWKAVEPSPYERVREYEDVGVSVGMGEEDVMQNESCWCGRECGREFELYFKKEEFET